VIDPDSRDRESTWVLCLFGQAEGMSVSRACSRLPHLSVMPATGVCKLKDRSGQQIAKEFAALRQVADALGERKPGEVVMCPAV
jgi:hypothetical protein